MKNCILLSLAMALVLHSSGQTPNTWVTQTNAPRAISWATSFSIGSNIYVCTGEDSLTFVHSITPDSLGLVMKFYKYNAAAHTWTVLAPFPGHGRVSAVSFAIGGSGYVGLGDDGLEHGIYGSSGARFNDFYKYDTLTNTWSTAGSIASFPFSDTVYNAHSFSIGNKGYVCLGGGKSSSSFDLPDIFSKYLYEYNPATNSWSAKSPFPGAARCAATGFVMDSIAFVGTGFNASGTLGDFYAYNPSTNTWSAPLSAYPGLSRASAIGFNICNYGYVGEGVTLPSGAYCTDLYQYDPISNTWSLMNSYPGVSRIGMISGTVYAGNTSFGYAGLGTNDDAYGTHVPNYSELYTYYPPILCYDTTSTLSAKTKEESHTLDIYPNPVENAVHLASSKVIMSCEVYNYSGEKIFSTLNTGNRCLDIDSHNWNPGIFYLKVITNEGSEIKKVIKLKN